MENSPFNLGYVKFKVLGKYSCGDLKESIVHDDVELKEKSGLKFRVRKFFSEG